VLLVSCANLLAQDEATPRLQASHRTNIGAAIADSIRLLAIEHGTRIAFQEKTRRELSGPFFKDYVRSIRWPKQWEDTDPWWVNYIGHPIHGAAAGLIWIDHGAQGDVPLGDKRYWSSRGRATAYAAIYSLQFEIGPFSEASIGNVGMRPETTGWVDHVVTPAGAFAVLIVEDALDRYFIRWLERHVTNSTVRGIVRVLFSPARTMANTAQRKTPWHRADRPLRP